MNDSTRILIPAVTTSSNKVAPGQGQDKQPFTIPVKAYDPYRNLSHFEKVKVQNELASQSITPFNAVDYIQVLFNPASKGPYQEIITVQLFKPMVSYLDRPNHDKQEVYHLDEYDPEEGDDPYANTLLQMKCPEKSHPLYLGDLDSNEKQKCKLCYEELQTNKQCYGCEDAIECQFFVCQPCELKHYVRHSLLKKNWRHHYYRSYELQKEEGSAIKKDPKQVAQNAQELQESKTQRFKGIEGHDLLTGEVPSTVMASPFASIIPEQTYEDPNSQVSEYVVIGFWRYEDNEYDCYKTFKVDLPCFQLVNQKDVKDRVFLHHAFDNQLVFFNKNSVDSKVAGLQCNFVDLKTAMSDKPVLLEPIKGVESKKLQMLSNFLYKMPTTKEYSISKELNSKLHELLLNCDDKRQEKTLIQIRKVGDQKLLVVPLESKLIFFDLEKGKVEFTVADADLLIDVEPAIDGKHKVMFLRHMSIIEMELGASTNLRSFNLLPQPERDSFALDNERLTSYIAERKNCNSLVTGYLHKDRSRVSINYTDGGVFTFELKPKQGFDVPSTWQGSIGEIQDFEMTNFKKDKDGSFTADGKDSAGDFTVAGTISADKNPVFEMTIKYKTGDSKIVLKGILDHDKATATGDVISCSKDLEHIKHLNKNQANKFKLIGHECQDRAVQLFFSTDFADARLCQIKDSKQASLNGLYAFGNMRKVAKSSSKHTGYQVMKLDLVNLDDDQLTSETDNKTTFNILMPSTFVQVTDRNGQKRFPYYVLQRPAFSVHKGNHVFKTQIFFHDCVTNQRRLVFIDGLKVVKQEKATISGQESPQKPAGRESQLSFKRGSTIEVANPKSRIDLLPPQKPPIMSENYTINYPILAYKSNLPNDQEIVIVNLANNEHQKFISIAPFKFVQFLEIGLHPQRHFVQGEDFNTVIYFLVSLNNFYYVMCYSQYPWSIDRNWVNSLHAPLFQFEGQMRMLTGRIEYQPKYNKSQVAADKIQRATLIKRLVPDGVKVVVVFQLVNEVICFNLTKNVTMNLHHKGFTMLPLALERGPGEQVFFGEMNQLGGQQLIQMTYVDKLPTTKVIFRTENEILQYSIAYQHKPSNPNCAFIYVLTTEQKIFRLSNLAGQFKIDREIDVSKNPGIAGYCAQLTQSLWNRFILRENNIIALVDNPNDQVKGKVLNSQSCMSELSFQLEPLYFDHDIRDNDGSYKQEQGHYSVLSLQQVPWMGKNIFEVQEAQNSFFLIKNQLGSRRIDLMRPDTQHIQLESQVFIGNSYIAVGMRNTNQVMLFDQKTLQVTKRYMYHMKPISTVQNGIQYFSMQYNGNRNEICRVLATGKIETVFDDMSWQLSELKDNYKLYLIKDLCDVKEEWAFVHQSHDKDLLAACIVLPSDYFTDDYLMKSEAEKNNMSISAFKAGFKAAFGQTELQRAQIEEEAKQYVQVAVYVLNQLGQYNLEDRTAPLPPVYSKKITMFLIGCPQLEFNAKDTQQIIFTKDYFVLKYGLNLMFCTFDKIESQNRDDSNQIVKEMVDDPLLEGGKPKAEDVLKKMIDGRKCLVTFSSIDTSMVSPHTLANDFHISAVADNDLRIAEKGEPRANTIQITFSDFALIWDLGENKEVTFLRKSEHFSSQKDYQPTGFVPHTCADGDKNMQKALFFSQNEDRSLIMSPQLESRPSSIFRTYCESDIYEVEVLQRRLSNNLYVPTLSFETMVANFNGLTFFQIFRQEEDVFTQLQEIITMNDYVKQKVRDESGEETDHILIRRLYRALQMPVIHEGYSEDIFKSIRHPSITQAAIFEEDSQHLLVNYMRLLMFSSEYRLSDLVANFEAFEKAFGIESNLIQEFLEDSHFETSSTQEVRTVKWNPDHKMITFGSSTSMLSAELIKQKVQEAQQEKLPSHEKYWANLQRAGINLIKKYFIRAQTEEPHAVSSQGLPQGQQLPAKFSLISWLGTKIKKPKLTVELQTQSVKVRIIEIEWVSDKMKDFYFFLNGQTNDKTFGNKFIKTLLEQSDYSWQLFWRVFLPYMSSVTCNLIYFSYYLPNVPVEGFFGHSESGTNFQVFLRIYIIFSAVISSIVECRECFLSNIRNYVLDPWNYILWSSNYLGVLTVIAHGVESPYFEHNTLIQMGSVQIVLQWIILYYWLRLFPQLAFYVNLVAETIKDIRFFMIMFVMIIIMFANALYAINGIKSNGAPAEHPTLWSPAFGSFFIDSVFSQYLIGLGQFETEPYSSTPASTLVLIYFILATLFTQIMFLNMLIAIMGKTFDRCVDAQERTALMEQTDLYSDFIWSLSLNKNLVGKRYLYVVEPTNEGADDDQLTAIANEQARMNELVQTLKTADREAIASLNARLITMLHVQQKNKADVASRFDQVEETLAKILAKLP